MVLVDTNVLLDILTDDPGWREWSERELLRCAEFQDLAINPIIYAELAAAYRRQSELDDALDGLPLERLELPYAAGFLAGHAFGQYRRKGGERRSPLPDFYIGAHAQHQGLVVLTRDAKRYRNYFPKVRLICPG